MHCKRRQHASLNQPSYRNWHHAGASKCSVVHEKHCCPLACGSEVISDEKSGGVTPQSDVQSAGSSQTIGICGPGGGDGGAGGGSGGTGGGGEGLGGGGGFGDGARLCRCAFAEFAVHSSAAMRGCEKIFVVGHDPEH
eukprot:6183857-Pleurochrysis_carterae.AAC.4